MKIYKIANDLFNQLFPFIDVIKTKSVFFLWIAVVLIVFEMIISLKRKKKRNISA